MHGQLIATPETFALLPTHESKRAASELAVPTGRPFSLGTTRLELVSTGCAPGAAGLLVENDGYRIYYAPSVGRGDKRDMRTADALIIGAHHGDPDHRLPAHNTVVSETLAMCEDATKRGACAVLIVGSRLAAMTVALELAEHGVSITARASVCSALRAIGSGTAARPHRGKTATAGHTLVWDGPPSAIPKLPPQSVIAWLSGDAIHPGAAPAAVDRALPWSPHADYDELLSYIESTKASDIYVLGPHGPALSTVLTGKRRRAQALGPATQLRLF